MRPLLAAALLVGLALAGCSDDGSGKPADPSDDGAAGVPTASGSQTSGPAPRPAKTHEVVMRDNRFVPEDLEVQVGDTVHWTTEDPQAHNVVSDSQAASFRSPDVSSVPVPGVYEDDFSYTFQQNGTVDYVCEYHSGMVGTILVVQTASA